MKTTFTILLLLLSFSVFSQTKRTRVDYIQNSKTRIIVGDTIRLGFGSGQNGLFVYVCAKLNNTQTEILYADAAKANKLYIVEDIFEENLGLNTSYLLHLNTGNMYKLSIRDLELAILKKEVLEVNGYPL